MSKNFTYYNFEDPHAAHDNEEAEIEPILYTCLSFSHIVLFLENHSKNAVNPFPHCTFDVAHLTAELQISPPQKDDMQNEDDSDDVTGADL